MEQTVNYFDDFSLTSFNGLEGRVPMIRLSLNLEFSLVTGLSLIQKVAQGGTRI